MNRKALASVAAVALALGAAACSDDGGNPAEAGAAEAGDQTTAGGESGESGGGSGGAESGAATPEGGPLDVELRHPSGVVLRLSQIAFEGDDVVIAAEVVNSSRQAVTFHQGNYSSSRLRLVDDAGQEYNFIETEEDRPVELEPGETLSGNLAFRGPLLGEPEQVRLVTNVYTEDLDAWNMSDESDTTYYPAFVVPIDLA